MRKIATSALQALKEIRVYPGSDTDFALYDDDGVSYDYERGKGRVVQLHWDNARAQLTGKGLSIEGLTKVVRTAP